MFSAYQGGSWLLILQYFQHNRVTVGYLFYNNIFSITGWQLATYSTTIFSAYQGGSWLLILQQYFQHNRVAVGYLFYNNIFSITGWQLATYSTTYGYPYLHALRFMWKLRSLFWDVVPCQWAMDA